jgi:hypothetical protein
MVTFEQQAQVALDAKQHAEHQLATAALCPPWRHGVFALIMAVIVGSPAAAMPLQMMLIALVFFGIVLVVRSDRKRLGMFINGYRRGRTRLVTFPLLVIDLVLFGASIYEAHQTAGPIFSLLLGTAAFGVSLTGSILWQRVFVRELRA